MTRNVAVRAFAACLVVASALVAWSLREVLAILLCAILISSAITPIARWLAKRGVRPRAALGFVYATLVLLVLGVGAFVGRGLVVELGALSEALGTGYDAWRRRWQAGSFVMRLLSDQLPAQLGEAPTALLGGATLGSTTAPLHLLTAVAWTLILAICWSYAGARIEQVGLRLLSPARRARAWSAWRAACVDAGDVLRGEVAESLVLLVVLGVVFHLAEVRYAVVAALLVAVLRLLPFVGGPVAVLVGGAAGLGVGPWHGALGAVFTALLLVAASRAGRARAHADAHPQLVAFVALAILIARGGIAVVFAPVIAAGLQGFVEGWLDEPGAAVDRPTSASAPSVEAGLAS